MALGHCLERMKMVEGKGCSFVICNLIPLNIVYCRTEVKQSRTIDAMQPNTTIKHCYLRKESKINTSHEQLSRHNIKSIPTTLHLKTQKHLFLPNCKGPIHRESSEPRSSSARQRLLRLHRCRGREYYHISSLPHRQGHLQY